MNDTIDSARPAFGMINAEMAFRWVYGGFLRERCTPSEVAKRVESILHAARWKYFIEHGRPMPLQVFATLQVETQRHVESHDEYFISMRRDYFFIDLFPDNDRRFPITMADCLASEM